MIKDRLFQPSIRFRASSVGFSQRAPNAPSATARKHNAAAILSSVMLPALIRLLLLPNCETSAFRKPNRHGVTNPAGHSPNGMKKVPVARKSHERSASRGNTDLTLGKAKIAAPKVRVQI